MARKALLAVMMLFPAATASSAVPLAVHSGETSLVIEVADKQRQSLRVTGSVLYFAKINPPAGAKLVVTVADASRADASAIVLARKSYAITTVPFRSECFRHVARQRAEQRASCRDQGAWREAFVGE